MTVLLSYLVSLVEASVSAATGRTLLSFYLLCPLMYFFTELFFKKKRVSGSITCDYIFQPTQDDGTEERFILTLDKLNEKGDGWLDSCS